MRLDRWRRPRFKRVLDLYEGDNHLMYEQIGRRLGESRSTIKNAIRKARQMRKDGKFENVRKDIRWRLEREDGEDIRFDTKTDCVLLFGNLDKQTKCYRVPDGSEFLMRLRLARKQISEKFEIEIKGRG